MIDDRDRELTRRFEELRRADNLGAPPFAAVRARTLSPRGSGSSRLRVRPALAFAGALIALGFMVVVFLARPIAPTPRPRPDAPSAIAEWKSPTEFLLETPGRELLGETPAPFPSVPAWALESSDPAHAPSVRTPLEKGAAS